MAETIKEKVSDVGHKIVEGAEKAADWVKDKTGIASSVRPNRRYCISIPFRCGANRVG